METFTYERRIRYSAGVSVVLHILLLTFAGIQPAREPQPTSFDPKPIVLNLQPEQEPKRLIDPGVVSDTVPEDAELISSHNTQAQSETAGEGDPSKPNVDQVDEFEQLGNPGSITEPEQIATPSVPQPEAPETEPEPEPTSESAAESSEESSMDVAAEPQQATEFPEPGSESWEPEEQEEPEKPDPESDPEEPMQVAQAEAASDPPVQDLRATRGREAGGAKPGGLSSFEARRHELGEYMLEIRNHVEREWRLSLQLHYHGVSRATALLDCSIRPDGTLEYVRIVDPGRSPGYATMCKAAVERAAENFPPFPFDVPPIYRSKNLEVRWRFTYM